MIRLTGLREKLWHCHRYEVKSGFFIAPGLSDLAEHELMEIIVSTYGKTWQMGDVVQLPALTRHVHD